MLIVLSPAKTLDYESPLPTSKFSQPAFLDDAQALVSSLRELSPTDISSLMKVSDKIGELNFQRFLNWHRPFDPDNARPALFAFKGDVYTGLDVSRFKARDLDYAQQHLRILSGLYGLLKPLDLMQPYRLEMGTRFANDKGKNLYEFWGERITEALNQDLATQGDDVLVNLASQEYFKAVKPGRLEGRVVTPVFKDYKNGQYKVISFLAKKARGLMAAWIIQQRVASVAGLEAFDVDGYRFSARDSAADQLVFLRRQ